ncbi:hypothetical protein BD779DRAFT_1558061 [Infundibulicybe gibba]|nr:hypothetical protein BD779DRAFT_1558061 [Infundibulicybe gibba]
MVLILVPSDVCERYCHIPFSPFLPQPPYVSPLFCNTLRLYFQPCLFSLTSVRNL